MPETLKLARYAPARFIELIEERYYRRINAQAGLEHLLADPAFLRDPESHIGLYSDHGVVHVRDVAQQLLSVLTTLSGTMLAVREPRRASWMRAYGVTLAYLHDVGMVAGSQRGRAVHPEFAAQLVFRPAFDELFELLWCGDHGELRSRLTELGRRELLSEPPRRVLRELLALALLHSKSKVSGAALGDRPGLRRILERAVAADLDELTQQEVEWRAQAAPATGEGFGWLVDPRPELIALADDALDVVRALRCADALRQRGNVLKTSGGYEIFIDQGSGMAVFGLRRDGGQLWLLQSAWPYSIGEANLASSELEPDGSLRVAFQRGAFLTAEARLRGADCAALIVNDVQQDVLQSFPNGADDRRRLIIEETDDNPVFAAMVIATLLTLDPALEARIELAPSLRLASAGELARYRSARPLDWGAAQRAELLARMERAGHNSTAINVELAFAHTRVVAVAPGEQLIEAGTPAGMIYVPLGSGLEVQPLGGYPPFAVQAWMPLGNTGVIRGASRNADVVATAHTALLAIPPAVYLRHWHRLYAAAELFHRLGPQIAPDLA